MVGFIKRKFTRHTASWLTRTLLAGCLLAATLCTGVPAAQAAPRSPVSLMPPSPVNLWETNETFNQDFRIGVMLAVSVQFKADVYTTGSLTAADATANGDELIHKEFLCISNKQQLQPHPVP